MLATLDSTDDLLLVSVPEVPTLKNAFLTLRTLELLSFPSERIRVTVNRKNLKAGLSRKDIEETLDHKVQYELPDDIAVQRGLNMGNATVVVERNSDFSRSLTSMVESLAAQDGKPVAVPTK
jgi:pilus assembly protein CpaE